MSIDYIISRIKNKEDMPLVEKAYNFVYEKLLGLCHGYEETIINDILEVTNTLIDFNADTLTIISSILYASINYGISVEELEKEFGISIANIALGVSKINNPKEFDNSENCLRYLSELKEESPEDFRILYITLASRICNMKKMGNLPIEYQRKVAEDTLNILVPAANKMGMDYIKGKVEDLCLYYLNPEAYNYILNKLNPSPSILRMYLNNMKESISKLLSDNNIKFKISARVKSIYSIYNKIISGKKWEDIYDILAIRILVDNEYECKIVAELIHSKYPPIPSRFKDYITFPKENTYQSLHTTIMGHENRFYEVQIRTPEMDKKATKGKAAHSLYKANKLKKNRVLHH